MIAATYTMSEPLDLGVEDVPDLNMELKKKKKKKKAMDLDMNSDQSLAKQADTLSVGAAREAEPTGDEELALDADEFALPTKKKKKKKSDKPKTEEGVEAEGADDEEFGLPMKKKKKKRSDATGDNAVVDVEDTPATKSVSSGQATMKPNFVEEGSFQHTAEANYKYEDLLKRVYDTLKARNPDYVAGERRRFVMKPPEVVRVSARKTAFANFTEIVKLMHRQQDHVMAFMLAELGTTGTLDGNQQLVVKARFQQKQIENVLRRYIREYVTCHTCKSPNTILTKEDRLFYLTCETCLARCTVAPIKSGYVAFTGRRSAQRRAAGM